MDNANYLNKFQPTFGSAPIARRTFNPATGESQPDLSSAQPSQSRFYPGPASNADAAAQNTQQGQPPAAQPDPNAGVTRAQPQASNATFAPSSVAGIYKATAPDGSVTFTDRPGGSFDANTAQPNAGGNQYDANGRRMIATAPDQLGGREAAPGNFSAADLTGRSGAKFLYRPQQGQEGADAGTKSGAMPGSTAWLNANNAPIDPLSSPDAAASFAANKNAVGSLRRGDGAFNRTIYDPSGYRASQVPSASGMGGLPPGVNPLDFATTQSNIQHKQAQDALHANEFGAGQNDKAQKFASDTVDRYMTDPRVAAMPEGERRGHAAALALPELYNSDPSGSYLNTREGLSGQDTLAKHFSGLINPGKLKNFFTDGPGPQQFGRDDLSHFQVNADNSAFANGKANLIGPGYTKGSDGNYQRVGPADTSPGSQHKYYTSEGNNLIGTEHSLTGGSGANDSLFGEGNQGLLNYAPLLNHLRQRKQQRQ